ncbi:hypothetical protein A2U01_0093313, partial [Trifolium medium]|nr:hypothetical protein [Trifolium medium]
MLWSTNESGHDLCNGSVGPEA